MRTDPQPFATYNWSRDRAPVFVVQILFDVSSPSFTSEPGIINVPGTLISNTLTKLSSVSQQVWPEEGRTTIGSLTVTIAETSAAAITDELREQLLDYNQGPRDRPLKLYVGYTSDFDEFVLVNTLYIDGISYERGTYIITARDKTRELREQICAPKQTKLTATLEAAATTMTVESTTGFQRIAHGTSYQDAPSSTVGYLLLEDTGEVIRYTGSTGTTFTGLTRGVFQTKAKAVPFETANNRDNWPKVSEYIYLELPGPLMAIALMTGVTDPTASPRPTLPEHWHLGMNWDEDFVQATWTKIGEDLYDPSNLALGFPIRFTGLDDEEGKSFLEREVFQLLGVYCATTTSGQLALRKINRVLDANGWLLKLTTANIISHGALKHDQKAVLNTFRVDYNWDGEQLTRSVVIVDNDSITRHGFGDQRVLKFKGLHTARHTERAIRERLAVLRDRYAEPPLRLDVKVAGYLNQIEIGDTVRVELPGVQDYTTESATLARTFEVQRVAVDWKTGEIELELFASARLIATLANNPTGAAPVPAGWYTSLGTNIASLTGYVAAVGATPARLTANVTLTGSATDIRASGSTWYHTGDLTIDSGVVITIVNNVQLRVRGFLQNNGKIDGKGRGPAGATDPDTVNSTSTGWRNAGTEGYLGPTRAGDGVWVYLFDAADYDFLANIEGPVVEGRAKATAAGPLALNVTASVLEGFPAILAGTSGSAGGQITHQGSIGFGSVRAKGGAGGAGGAGLLLVCRGLGFGPSGQVDTGGNDGTAGGKTSGYYIDALNADMELLVDYPMQAGAGAGGYPGAFYVVLDGDDVPYPDISATTFKANRGDTPVQGNSAVDLSNNVYTGRRSPSLQRFPYPRYSENLQGRGVDQSPEPRLTGRNEHWQGAALNIWAAAHYIQRAPALPTPQQEPVLPPSSLTTATGLGLVRATWNWPIAANIAHVELWASTTNDRSFAEEVANIAGSTWNHSLPAGGTRYYWVRARHTDGRGSSFYPSSTTAGVIGIALDSATEIILTANPTRNWAGDGTTSPITWQPAAATTTLYVEVRQLGVIVAQEVITVTRTSAGALTYSVTTDHADIETEASATPANTIDFTFTHTPTELEAFDTVFALTTGEPGPPGDPGAPGNRVLGFKRNYKTWSTAAAGWIYVHGFDADGNAADVDGEVVIGNTVVTVPRAGFYTSQQTGDETANGWIMFDTALFGTFEKASAGSPFLPLGDANLSAVRKTRTGWVYDDGTAWVPVSPAGATCFVIGSYQRGAINVGAAVTFGNALTQQAVPVEFAHIVQAGDLQPGAIDDALAFASGLQPIPVVSSLPAVSGYTGPTVVFRTTDRKLYRFDNTTSPHEWTVAVDGADIIADTVTAGAIQAGAIGTTALAADAVTTSKLAVKSTTGMALNADPFFTDTTLGDDETDEEHAWRHAISTSGATIITTSTGPGGTNALRKTASPSGMAVVQSREKIPVNTAKTYRVRATIRSATGDRQLLLGVEFLDTSGDVIDSSTMSPVAAGWASVGTHHYFRVGVPPTTYTTYETTFGAAGIADIPTGAHTMRLVAVLNYSSTGTTDGTPLVQDFRVEEVLGSVAIEDGAVTADKVAAGAITTAKLDAGAVTAEKIAAGSITADRLVVGTLGTNLLPNGNFETGVLEPWTTAASGVSIVSSGADSTSYRLRIVATSSTQWVRSGYIPVLPGMQFQVDSQWITAAGVTSVSPLFYPSRVEFTNATKSSPSYLDLDQQDAGNSSAWQPSSQVFTVPAGKYWMRVGPMVAAGATTGNTFYFDQYVLTFLANAVTIADGGVTAAKLEATLVLGSTITTADPTDSPLPARVILDNTTVPLWIGSGAKTEPNARIQYDAATDTLTVRAVIKASVIDPDEDDVLGVLAATDKTAPAVNLLIGVDNADDSLSTSWDVGASAQVTHPSAGADGLVGTRLQHIGQSFLVIVEGMFFNPTGGDITYDISVQYKYDAGGSTTDLDGYTDGVLAQVVCKAGRPLLFKRVVWVKPKTSGWSSYCTMSMRVRGSASGGYVTGRSLTIFLPNLGATIASTYSTMDDG